ncbi:MAG: S26 family signal peptidase, partial [Bacteroidales bacterium]|nr:S26 family signal peptidase [Bacteroidales bacterium]
MDKSLPNDIFFGLVTDQLEQGRTITIPLTGTSMSPTLQQGRDNLVLAPLSPNVPLRRYDVVLFRYRGAYILHRIMKIK